MSTKTFLWQNKTESETAIITEDQLLELDDNFDWTGVWPLHAWVKECDRGDRWEDAKSVFVRL